MSGGTASLDQALPNGSGSAQEYLIPEQPVPLNADFGVFEGSANDAAAGNALHARDVLLQGLEQEYVLDVEVRSFLRVRPTAITVLLEAAAYLNQAFGQGCIKAIRLVPDDFESCSAFGIVLWAGSMEQARTALANFDERWWLRNCNRAAGIVNFNIELT